ncbi:hypothetical protein KEM48_014537, partial [Puccinia striiformis f. sp. tritici PST-130]
LMASDEISARLNAILATTPITTIDVVDLSAHRFSSKDLEACLFCIRAIQDGIPSEENTALPLWLKHRAEPSTMLSQLGRTLLNLSDPETISLAANALRRLCHEGRKVLVNEIAALAELIRSTEGKIMVGQTSSFRAPMSTNKVLQAVASVLQALPAKDLVRIFVLRDIPLAPDPDNRMVIITQLQQLKACNQGLSEPDEELILLDIDDDSNPEKEKMAQLAQLEPIRNLQHTLSQLISNALVQSLGDVDMAVIPLYSLQPVSPNISRDRTNLAIWFSLSLQLVSATCRLKGQDFPQDQWNTLVGCVKESVKVTASVLNSDAQMIQEPDLVQTFLQLCSAIIERYGQMFVALKDELQIILTIAIAGLKVEERVALQAALDILLLRAIVAAQSFRPAAHKASSPAQADLFLELLTIHGQQVLNHIVLGISGKLPRSSLPSLSETLHCFVIKLPHLSQMWLTQLMQLMRNPGYPNEKLTEEKKVRFLKNICAARTLKKARDVCTDFAIVSRGLEGTAYGASQMSLSFAD